MTSKQLQLHMMPEDMPGILGLLRDINAGTQLCVGKRGGQFCYLNFENGVFDISEDYEYIAVSLQAIDCSAQNIVDFVDLNPGVLIFIIPRIKNGLLNEVTVSSVSNDNMAASQMVVWGKFLRKLRSTLISGACVTNKTLRSSGYYRNAHATVAAVAESKSGRVELTSGNGEVVFDYREVEIKAPKQRR